MMRLRETMRGNGGSLTVEASLTFPVFLCFFLLLAFFARFACISIVLHHAVSETAKQLATSCYPVHFINELEDEWIEESGESALPTFSEELGRLGEQAADATARALTEVLSDMLSGSLDKDDLTDLLNGIGQNLSDTAAEEFEKGIRGYLVGRYAGQYYAIKTKAKYDAAKAVMGKFLEGSPVAAENVQLLFAELPQGYFEYGHKASDPDYKAACAVLGYVPGQEDVMVAAEYAVKLPLPFFGRLLVAKHLAVERAWIHGSNGVYAVEAAEEQGEEREEGQQEGGEEGTPEENNPREEDKKIVYVTKTGKKYHERECGYLEKSRIPYTLSTAQKKGYTPCRVCILKTAEPIKKKVPPF